MKLSSLLRTVLPGAFFIFLLAFPATAGEAVLSRTVFFVSRVFPTLFLSLCLGGMLVDDPRMSKLYEKPWGVECTVFLLGVLCGFPLGARSAMQLYGQGRISRKRAEFLCGFTNLASAPFLLGVVGNTLFGKTAFGWRLIALQAVCGLLTAGVLYACLRPACKGVCGERKTPASLLFHITSATYTALEVGGMLIFFGAAGDCLQMLLRLQGVPAVLMGGFWEFSAGCGKAAELGGKAGAVLAGISVGFSGLCVLGQVAAVTKGKLSLAPYLGGKLIQTALMGVGLLLFS